jgi:hypothetical protein
MLKQQSWVTEELEHDLGLLHWDSSQDYSGVRLPQGLCAIGYTSALRRPQGAKNG